MSKRPAPRAEHLRNAIAQEAARLMAEHGIRDYLVAKRKAADRFGVSDSAVLPKNTEIEAALMGYQRLFGGDEHAAALHAQRSAALTAMRGLSAFEPRLVGPVLSGTATAHTDVQLHLFADSLENVSFALMDRGIEHEVIERGVKLQPDRVVNYPGLRFEVDEQTVEATVFPRVGIRQAPASPVDGRPMRRADYDEVAALIEADKLPSGSVYIRD